MSKFKIGDRVKVYCNVPFTGKITGIDSLRGNFFVTEDGFYSCHNDSPFHPKQCRKIFKRIDKCFFCKIRPENKQCRISIKFPELCCCIKCHEIFKFLAQKFADGLEQIICKEISSDIPLFLIRDE